jgi:phosphoglycerate kinase
MKIKSLRDTSIRNKRVFLRLDLNVPIKHSEVLDAYKIQSSLESIDDILSQKPRSLIIGSHLGRPGGQRLDKLSLRPVHEILRGMIKEKFDVDLGFCDMGSYNGSFCMLLENLRFYRAEERDDDEAEVEKYRAFFTQNADVAVIDAFGCLHRKCRSIQHTGLPAYAGPLVEREMNMISSLLESNMDLVILGGCKISDKLGLIDALGRRTRVLALTGGLAFSFLKFKFGKEVGKSIVDEGGKEAVERAYSIAKECGTEIILPTDFVILRGTSIYTADSIPADGCALDVGPRTIEELEARIKQAKVVFWNGPPGCFEKDKFSSGTERLVQYLAECKGRGAECFCGGGETALAVTRYSDSSSFTYVSTGGGVLMELLSGRPLPGLEVLMQRDG